MRSCIIFPRWGAAAGEESCLLRSYCFLLSWLPSKRPWRSGAGAANQPTTTKKIVADAFRKKSSRESFLDLRFRIPHSFERNWAGKRGQVHENDNQAADHGCVPWTLQPSTSYSSQMGSQ